MSQMTGGEIRALLDALDSAFDRASFAQMLRLRLDRNLDTIVGPGCFNTLAFELIQVALREGWVVELIRAARDDNPGNPALQRFCAEHPHLAPEQAAGPMGGGRAGQRAGHAP